MRLEFVLNVEKEMASLTEDEIEVSTESLRGSADTVGSSDGKKHWALRPQKPLRLIRDGEVGGWGIFIS